MKRVIHIVLIILIIVISYAVYYSISKKIEFHKEVVKRTKVVQKRLTKIKDAQVLYKHAHQEFCKPMSKLINFIKYDSIPIIKSYGTRPDSVLTDAEAVKMGIIERDTLMIAVKDTLNWKMPIDSLAYIPFSKGKKFDLDAGIISRGRVKVSVFMAFASYKDILNGLDLTYSSIKPEEGLQIGSMKDPILTGNW